jgi:glycosyltransferase involved in cell wall biosynthesis
LWQGLRRERPDIILSYTTWPNIGCGLVWRWSPAKVCIWGQRDVAPFKGHWVERFAYRGASAVICNAAHEMGHLNRSLGETSASMHLVHNGIHLAPPRKTRSQWRAELGMPDDVPVAAMLANLRSDKDHATLLHAWRRVMDSLASPEATPRLVLAGAHQESFADVKSLVSKLSLSNSVCLPGQVDDVAGFLSACDVGILCTRAEGLSNAVLEYMACGLPVVATDIPGNREALGDHADEQLCEAGDAVSLADKLQTLLRAPELRKALGARNRQRAAETFSIEAMCRSMSAVITNALYGA